MVLSLVFIGISYFSNAQSDLEQITETINHYMEGTSNGEPDRIKEAFHENLNLYSITEDQTLKTWNGKEYISIFKEGQKNNRVGRIISIDFENNAAIAKAEILIPGKKLYTDYFMLLKIEGEWKIVHKAYTSRALPL
ncbi:nuclear transport factor 2 family protein [Gramella sp. KN1008]|nr:nuclear transport factor 2 family protein [Gramella sp. KN1008]